MLGALKTGLAVRRPSEGGRSLTVKVRVTLTIEPLNAPGISAMYTVTEGENAVQATLQAIHRLLGQLLEPPGVARNVPSVQKQVAG